MKTYCRDSGFFRVAEKKEWKAKGASEKCLRGQRMKWKSMPPFWLCGGWPVFISVPMRSSAAERKKGQAAAFPWLDGQRWLIEGIRQSPTHNGVPE